MIWGEKNSKTGCFARILGVRPERATKLPCCASISSNSTRTTLRQSCHLYANLEVDKEKTRERKLERRSLRQWGRRQEEGKRERIKTHQRESTHVIRQRVVVNGGGTPDDEGSFSEGGLHAVRGRDYTESSVFRFSKRSATCGDNSHCAFHSVGRFEIQARIPFVLGTAQRGDKRGWTGAIAEGDSI